MTPDIHDPVDWNTGAEDTPWGSGFDHEAGDGTEPPAGAGADGNPGPDLLGFLSDFRTASNQEAQAGTGGAGSARLGSAPALDAEELDDEPAPDADDPYSGRDVPLAADWWLASDGRWYPPELHPDFQAQPPAEATAEPAVDERPAAAASVRADDLGRPGRRSPWPRRLLARSAMPQPC